MTFSSIYIGPAERKKFFMFRLILEVICEQKSKETQICFPLSFTSFFPDCFDIKTRLIHHKKTMNDGRKSTKLEFKATRKSVFMLFTMKNFF